MRLVLGGAQFGLDYGLAKKNKKIKKDEINKIKTIATKHHISFIDTATIYNESESIIGQNKFINFKIITKIKKPKKKIKNIDNWTNKTIYSSLKNLKIKKIYGVLFHDYKDLLSNDGKKILNSLIFLKKKKNYENWCFNI